ncbi:putative phosphoric monoester hydrolase [Helianthus debilis subsp. tardiflorus]
MTMCSKKILYVLDNAGHDLKLVRMAVPLRDMDSENLLDSLEVSLDFIDESRKTGSVLVHCFAGVSRSAAIVTVYLMRTERISLEGLMISVFRFFNISYLMWIINCYVLVLCKTKFLQFLADALESL